MNCESCQRAKVNLHIHWMTNGCASCEGRALALAGFQRRELSENHSPEVIKAFEEWMPAIRQSRSSHAK